MAAFGFSLGLGAGSGFSLGLGLYTELRFSCQSTLEALDVIALKQGKRNVGKGTLPLSKIEFWG